MQDIDGKKDLVNESRLSQQQNVHKLDLFKPE